MSGDKYGGKEKRDQLRKGELAIQEPNREISPVKNSRGDRSLSRRDGGRRKRQRKTKDAEKLFLDLSMAAMRETLFSALQTKTRSFGRKPLFLAQETRSFVGEVI